MPFATRTVEQIRDGILRDLRIENPNARTEEGSHEWVRATALANALLPIYANGAHGAKQSFPDTCDETTLERFGKIYGPPRLGDQFAVGTVRVSGSFGATIASGTTLTNPASGNRYRTTHAVTIDPVTLTATVAVVALQPGSGSDALPGTVLAFNGPPSGVDTNASVISISGGDSAWSNGRWAVEIIKRRRQAPHSGNEPHIVALCTSVGGVEQAFVYPALRGGGTMDVVVTVAQTTGTRVAGTALLAQVLGAMQVGITAPDGSFIGGIPEDVFRNTRVHAVVEESTDVQISLEASAANPWEDWPPIGVGYMVPGDPSSWYIVDVAPTTQLTFRVAKPATGTVVAPTGGDIIGAFFPASGFCKATVLHAADAGAYWTITVGAWTDSNGAPPTGLFPVDTVIVPWNAQLTNIAGAPAANSEQLTGAVPEYFAALGPGEMTALTAEGDETRRRRWPRTTDANPVTGELEWPTDVTSRLLAAILRRTDAPDASLTIVGASTPTVPSAAYIGTPPRILVLGALHVIPKT